MIEKLTATALCAGLVLSPAATGAQEAVFWKSVGNWEVSIDTTIRNGCYAVATWDGGTVLRIGLNPKKDNFYFLIGNEKWSSLRHETDYVLEIQFDQKAPWEVSARGLQFNPREIVYLHAESTNAEFIAEFMRLNRMKISYDGAEIDTLSLAGSRRAFREVIACQDEIDEHGVTGSDDPFSGAGAVSGSSTGSGKGSRKAPSN